MARISVDIFMDDVVELTAESDKGGWLCLRCGEETITIYGDAEYLDGLAKAINSVSLAEPKVPQKMEDDDDEISF